MFLKRLFVGLIVGAILGAIVAAVLVQGLGLAVTAGTSAVIAYLAAAGTGLLTGLVAGKPVWSANGKIEAGLKAFFGLLLALGGLFVLRRWVHVNLDLSALKAGTGSIGDLPAAYLPVIAGVLGGFFELDNDDSGKEEDAKDNPKVRVASKAEADLADDEGEELEEEPPANAKKKR